MIILIAMVIFEHQLCDRLYQKFCIQPYLFLNVLKHLLFYFQFLCKETDIYKDK
jgi:hypothetical protein